MMVTTIPIRTLCTYRVQKGREADFQALLEKHWPTLHGAGLTTSEPAQVLRGRDRSGDIIFIETFFWKDAGAPKLADQTPAVMAVRGPMGALAREMNFWMVETVPMPFEQK